MDPNPIEQSDLKLLKELVRTASLSRLKGIANNENIQIAEIAESQKILGHWMSLILISGPKMRITFKVNFTADVARSLALWIYQGKATDILTEQAGDFIKEFCNLVGGKLKNTLSLNDVFMGLSLPLMTRSFDDIFFRTSPSLSTIRDRWKLQDGQANIYCAATIEIFERLNFPPVLKDDSNSGDVEFLT